MKKTLFLSALLGFGLCSVAMGGVVTKTTDSSIVGGTTYSGGVYTLGGSGNYSARTFTADVTSVSGNIAQGSTARWQDFANTTNVTGVYGHTLHLTGTNTDQSVKTDFGPFTLGGLIVDDGTGTWTLGRTDGASQIQFDGNNKVQLTLNGSVKFDTTSGVVVKTDSDWNIASGKTLTMNTIGTTTTSVDDGVAITVHGGGAIAFNNSIVLNGSSSLSLEDGTGIVLDNLTHSTSTTGDTTTSGLTTATTTYTLATGTGTVSTNGTINFTLNGSAAEGATMAADNKSASISSSVYNVAAGDTKGMDEVNSTITDAGTSVEAITVSGTLTGFTNTTQRVHGLALTGDGTIQVNGTLDYHAYSESVSPCLDGFTGTLEIADGGVLQTGNTTVLPSTVALKVTNGGVVKSWGTFSHAVELAGGDLTHAGAAANYSGGITVTADSTITGTGAAVTISGTKANGVSGTITTHGNVTQNAILDMNGSESDYTGKLVVADGTFTSGNSIWVNTTNPDIMVKNGATFSKDSMTLTAKEGTDATISLSGNAGANYTLGAAAFTISDADLTFAAVNKEIANALENVSVTGGKTVDAETGAVTYNTTVKSAMGNQVSLKDVKMAELKRTATGTDAARLDNVSGYFNKATAMGNLEIGAGGVTVNNGYTTNDATTFNNLSTATGEKATLAFAGDYSADDTFQLNGTISQDITLEMNREKAGKTTTFKIAQADTTIGALNMLQGNLKLKADGVTVSELTLSGGTLTAEQLGATDLTTITSTAATVTADSTVTANLATAANSTLTFTDGVVTLNGKISFGAGTVVSLGSAYEPGLLADGRVLLFTGVESVLGAENVTVTSATGSFTPGFLIVEEVSTGGTTKYNIYATPEPATATLSLLALAGLCARRRRH